MQVCAVPQVEKVSLQPPSLFSQQLDTAHSLSDIQQCSGSVFRGVLFFSVGMNGKAVNIKRLVSGSSLLEQTCSILSNPFATSHSLLVGLFSAFREKLNFAGYPVRNLELGLCPWEDKKGGEGGVHPPSLLTK